MDELKCPRCASAAVALDNPGDDEMRVSSEGDFYRCLVCGYDWFDDARLDADDVE